MPASLATLLAILVALTGTQLGHAADSPAAGRIVEETFSSKALAGNALGDSPDRKLLVYLPPSYDQAPDRRYPVLYLLHGNGIPVEAWIQNPLGWKINESIDAGIAEGTVSEMIVVMPDAYNRYHGSQYTNSSTTGNWETFITEELVAHIDKTYRTLADQASRGLAGHSMGGRGTLYYAMRHPKTYAGFYAVSAGVLGFDDYTPLFRDEDAWKAVTEAESFDDAPVPATKLISFAAAWSPNPGAEPFKADFPYRWENGELTEDPVTWGRWMGHDPFVLAQTYASNLRTIAHLHFECGLQDPFITPNRALHDLLERLEIEHSFSSFEGNHTDHLPQRITEGVLPYFSKLLAEQSSGN